MVRAGPAGGIARVFILIDARDRLVIERRSEQNRSVWNHSMHARA